MAWISHAWAMHGKLCTVSKTIVLSRNRLMPANHLLDTKDTVPTISPMKNQISPDIKSQRGKLNYRNKEQKIQQKGKV